MSTHSTDGRPWAKLSELKVGDKLLTDGGFMCMNKGVIKEVRHEGNPNWLYIECEEGRHYLDGQLSDVDNDSLVGLWKA